MQVYVEINQRRVSCGTIAEVKDEHGNGRYHADRTVCGDTFLFYTKGAAELWLRLGGLLRG